MTRLLHAPVHAGIQLALKDIFEGGYPADKVIQRQLKGQKKWGSHDRRLFAESVYDIVRWWRRLLFAVDVPWPKDDRWAPAEAEVYAAVTQAWCGLNNVEVDRKIARVKMAPATVESVYNDPGLPRAVRASVPDWMDRLGSEQLGSRWESLVDVLNTVAPVYLRANRLQITPEKLVANLAQEKIEAEIVAGDTLRLRKRANVFLTPSFRAGHFEVQDLHSQAVAPALGAQPGERVIDACAGAGGKSLHLAALMNNKGKIVALDVAEKKLQQLRERSTRARATSIEVRIIDSTKVIKRLVDSADRLLLDVPCSGFGVFRRNPDAKWKLTPSEVERVQGLQREILQSYSPMVKVGGTLVYATCSVLPSENERQVEAFVSRHETAWKIEQQRVLWPEKDGGDGFFVSRITRLS